MRGDEIRLTHTTLKVLRAFLDDPSRELSGADVWREAKVLSGSRYPILMRLEEAGWLTSRWEIIDPREAGRPRRRYYKLTSLGCQRARAAFDDLGVVGEAPAWST